MVSSEKFFQSQVVDKASSQWSHEATFPDAVIASQKHGSQNREAQIDFFASIDATGTRQRGTLATHQTRTNTNPLTHTHRVAV